MNLNIIIILIIFLLLLNNSKKNIKENFDKYYIYRPKYDSKTERVPRSKLFDQAEFIKPNDNIPVDPYYKSKENGHRVIYYDRIFLKN